MKDRSSIDLYSAGMSSLLETRELRYFLAVAEELHFGRAAERLGMAQPPLSRAIRQLEQRLGVPLLNRSTRHVSLTAAGAVLAEEGPAALTSIEAMARRAQRAGVARSRLVLALKADSDAGLLPDALAEYESGGARPSPELLLGGWGDQARMLRDGRADVACCMRPSMRAASTSQPLLSEPRVLALAAGHRLARRRRLTLADLASEPFPRWEGEGGERDRTALVRTRSRGRPRAATGSDTARARVRTAGRGPVAVAAPRRVGTGRRVRPGFGGRPLPA